MTHLASPEDLNLKPGSKAHSSKNKLPFMILSPTDETAERWVFLQTFAGEFNQER